MDNDLFRTATIIEPGALLKIPDAMGRTILCASGQLWLTQHHDRADILLNGGQRFTFNRPGDACAQAIGPTSAAVIVDSDAAATARDRRPVAAGRGLPAVIDRLLATLPRPPHWHEPAHPARISLPQLALEARQMRTATVAYLVARAVATLRALLAGRRRGRRAPRTPGDDG